MCTCRMAFILNSVSLVGTTSRSKPCPASFLPIHQLVLTARPDLEGSGCHYRDLHCVPGMRRRGLTIDAVCSMNKIQVLKKQDHNMSKEIISSAGIEVCDVLCNVVGVRTRLFSSPALLSLPGSPRHLGVLQAANHTRYILLSGLLLSALTFRLDFTRDESLVLCYQ